MGRGIEVRRILGWLDDPSVRCIVLSADSGIGKSSLLKAGVLPRVRGFEPLVCDKWAARRTVDAATFDIERHLYDVIVADGMDEDRTANSGWEAPFTSWLLQTHRRAGLVVLDQFEELIRYEPANYDQILEWIAGLANDYGIRFLISLRSEFVHRLKSLDQTMRPHTIRSEDLGPIVSEKSIRKLIADPIVGTTTLVEGNVAYQMLNVWRISNMRSLLGIQALCYSLYWRSKIDGCDGRINQDTWAAFIDGAGVDYQQEITAPVALRLLGFALEEAVETKLNAAERALREPESGLIDTVLAAQTRAAIRLMVHHLSAGGFKLHRESWELAEHTLDRELRLLSRSIERADMERAFRHVAMLVRAPDKRAGRSTDGVVDLLTASVEELLPEDLSDVAKVTGKAGAGAQPWELDPKELTSGFMLGLSPLTVLVEEYRRYFFALEWLEQSQLIRSTGATSDSFRISLIHDGFGAALARWSETRTESPSAYFSRQTASYGELFEWSVTDDSGDLHHGRAADRTIVNLRWINCEIRGTDFEHVRFVNCDFRGSRFVECEFEGAVFINCLLDGVRLRRCAIVGSAAPYSGYASEGRPDQFAAPSFEVPFEGDAGWTLRLIERYRDVRAAGRHGPLVDVSSLVSHTSGIPAVPATKVHLDIFSRVNPESDAGMPPRQWLAPLPESGENGGFAMLGGRINSLSFEDMTFRDDGSIGLRLVSGTALDVVGNTKGALRLDIVGSAIRATTITAVGIDGEPVEIDLSATDSLLTETLLGHALRGRVRFTNTAIWTFMSIHESGAIEFDIAECLYNNVVNAGDLPYELKNEPDPRFSDNEIQQGMYAKVVAASSRMDYQALPARYEDERRAAVARWPSLTNPASTSDTDV